MTVMEALAKCKSVKILPLNEILMEWNARTKKKPPMGKITLPDELSEDILKGIVRRGENELYAMLVWVKKEEYNSVE
jgi:hypothetical protein